MRSIKAIIIDDEPSVLSTLKRILEHRRYEVATYADPVQTPMYQTRGCPCTPQTLCPDLIISDYDMPVVNGAELLESSVKKGCRCRHLALISGKGLPEVDLIRMAKYGTRYFLKPLDFDDFYDWLDRVEMDIARQRLGTNPSLQAP